MMVHIPGEDIPLPFQSPAHMCCNCGVTSGTEMKEVKLKHTRYMIVAGTELTFVLQLPFCVKCKKTANRIRQGPFSKTLMAFGIFWVIVGLLLMTPTEYLPGLVKEQLLPTSTVAACLLTVMFYSLRRPSKPGTSFYQPVFLGKLKQTFRGEVQGITLRFTNHDYAAQFRSMNRAICDTGSLAVDVV